MTLEQIKTRLREKAPSFAKKVAPLYKALGWQWEKSVDNPHFPSEDEIVAGLNNLINKLSKKFTNWGTGGLEVYYELPTPESSGNYGISFHFSDMDFYDYTT